MLGRRTVCLGLGKKCNENIISQLNLPSFSGFEDAKSNKIRSGMVGLVQSECHMAACVKEAKRRRTHSVTPPVWSRSDLTLPRWAHTGCTLADALNKSRGSHLPTVTHPV